MNTNLNKILTEQILKEAEGKGSGAGCLMLDFKKKIKNWDDVIKIIEPSDLYDDETKTYGFEDEPHVTVLYGFEPHVTANDVQDLFEDINQFVKIRLMGIDIFPAKDGDKPYDVVKFNVQSDDLEKLHDLCKENLPNNESYPEYHPHMTIAYVKAGTGKRYVKEFNNPIYMEGNTFTYSTAEKKKTEWKIKKKYRYEININENLRLIELFSDNNLNERENQINKTDLVKQAIQKNDFENPSPESFKNSLSKSKHSAMLTDYSVNDLSKMKLFKLNNYDIGFALKQFPENGKIEYSEIVAVHNNEPEVKGIGEDLIKSAIAHGGKHLDHFDGFLSNLYSKLGFQEYKRDAYNPEFDPNGSFANTYGKQDVIYRKFAN